MAIDKKKVSAAAQKYISKGAWDRAIRELRKLVDADPDDEKTLRTLGNVYVKKGDKGAAVDIFLELAELYRETGFKQKTIAVYKQVLQLSPDRVDVAEGLGALYHAQGLTRDALTQYRQLLTHFKEANDVAGCERILASMCHVDPENVGVRVKYAEHIARQKRLDEALKQFHYAASLLIEQGRDRDFLKIAERILFHDSENEDILKQVVKIYLQTGQARQALSKLQKLYSFDPQDEETLELLSEAFIALNQESKAVSVLKELARVYEHNQQDEEQAVRTWRRALALDPEDPEILLALQMGDDVDVPMLGDSAVVSMEALENETGPGPRSLYGVDRNEEVNRLVAECEACLGYNLTAKAEEHLSRIYALDPNNLEARSLEVTILEQQGRFADAAEQLRSISRDTWGSDKDLALQYAQKAKTYDPNNPANFQLVLSFGLDPTAYGFSPPGVPARRHPTPRPQPATPPPRPQPPTPPPQRSQGAPPPLPPTPPPQRQSLSPPPTPLSEQKRPPSQEAVLLNNWELAPTDSPSLPQPQRPDVYTLPPSAFDILEDDAPTPASGPPAVLEEHQSQLTFNLDHISRDLPPAPSQDSEIDSLDSFAEDFNDLEDFDEFDIDEDDDIDDLFNDSVFGAFAPSGQGNDHVNPHLMGDSKEVADDATPREPNPAIVGPAMTPSPTPERRLSADDLRAVSADLDELDFYLSQGFFSEASEILNSLFQRFGDHPLILAAQARLQRLA